MNVANPTVIISWTIEDFGGSGLQQVELFRRKLPGDWPETALQTNTSFSGSGPISGSFLPDEPTLDGTYEYGIHIVDNTENCITECATDCLPPGLDPGDGITRTVFLPIEVQVDKTIPSITCTNGGDFENGTIVTVTCDFVDSPDGDAIYYTTDNTDPNNNTSTPYNPSDKPSFNGSSGDIIFRAIGYDVAENPSSIIQRIYNFGDPPNVTITVEPPNPDNNTTPTFTFTVSGSSSSQCKIDSNKKRNTYSTYCNKPNLLFW